MKIECLKVNHIDKPLGYDFSYLTFSWKVTGAVSATADRVRLIISENKEMNNPVYDSGELMNFRKSHLSISLSLKARTRYYWRVIISTKEDGDVESEVSFFETAKLEESWKAKWIAAKHDEKRMPILYREFAVKEPVKTARLYIFGAGLYEVHINGQKAGDEFLLPGYHSYDFIMEYQTFDVTKLLRDQSNCISILLGEGWYKGRFGFDDVYVNLYGDKKKCIAELVLTYESGREEWICTDETWKARHSNILENGIYDGEVQDDTLMEEADEVIVLKDDTSLLTERSNPPIHKVQEYSVVFEEQKQGYFLLDFGETITGWVEFTGNLEKGQKIRLQYGELLQNGEFYRDNLRTAKAEFGYTSDGTDKVVRPHFTYYGFRYVKVEGLEEGQKLSFKAYRLMSDIERTGKIKTSNEKINRLIENTVRSQQCNFLDIPTDCPQRDERMGWTGDVNIFSNTACFHMDSIAFFRHYARSLYREQKLLKGAVPYFAPMPKVPVKENTNLFYFKEACCVWGDVTVMLPWTLYQYYGDVSLLREQYPMMKSWVEYIRGRASENKVPNLWQNDMQLGDWLALDGEDINNLSGKTDTAFLASACYYWSTMTLTKAAKTLSLMDAEVYEKLAREIRQSFLDFYFDADGKLTIEATQTACAILLHIGLYPESAQKHLAEKLEQLIKENGGHLNTGFVGTPLLCPVLSEIGLNELAYSLLLNEEYPGWLYEVNLGATTVWERWNSLDENGMISSTGMNSLNHYAYGSIADWMYRYMCGFRPHMAEEIKMTIEPMPDQRFSYVEGTYDSIYGTYVCRWNYIPEKGFRYYVEIPFNANAQIKLANGKSYLLQSGVYYFDFDGELVEKRKVI